MTDNSMPTPEDAFDFQKVVAAGLTKTNALADGCVIDYDTEVREKVLSHSFYAWLTPQRKFQKSLKHLSDKGFMGNSPDRRKIEIARCVAILYPCFCYYSAHPERLGSITKGTGSKALKSIKSLLELLDCDLQMESPSDSTNLRILLLRLNFELSGDLPTTYPKSKHGDLLGMRLVMELHADIKYLIGEAPTFVVSQLVSIMHDVSKQQVRRYTKQIKAIS